MYICIDDRKTYVLRYRCMLFIAILLESNETFFVAFGLKECVGVAWIEIRDMDCDFVVLDFVGSVSCSIYNRTHYKPANDGPTTKIIDMLDHAFKFLSQIEAFFLDLQLYDGCNNSRNFGRILWWCGENGIL
jgi:hypothetical protein